MAHLYYGPSEGSTDGSLAPAETDTLAFSRVLRALENLARAEDELAAAVANAGEAFEHRLSVVSEGRTT